MALSKYGEITDERGKIDNNGARQNPIPAVPGLGAIPIGYNNLPTSQIMDKWGGFNKVIPPAVAVAAATPRGPIKQNIQNHLNNPTLSANAYAGSTINIINNLSKLL
jgi:hypothetical protein